MSRRTAESSKAIRLAWQRERELVAHGQGTRDWTREQQRDILDGRSAHDEDGKAFEGHHMMSAEAHPELQGEPGNIQFLTRSEHLEAHGGAWSLPTRGYFDPVTHVTSPFPDGSCVPREPFNLSSPVTATSSGLGASDSEGKTPEQHASTSATDPAEAPQKSGGFFEAVGKVGHSLSSFGRHVASFAKANPVVAIGMALGAVAGVADAIASTSDSEPTDCSQCDELDDNLDLDISQEAASMPDDVNTPGGIAQHDYPSERQPPCEHTVRAYDRTQNGKAIHVGPYTRGGSKKQTPDT